MASAKQPTDSRRTCVVTGAEEAPEAMLRFALSPDGVVTPDIRRKLPGRGVWTRLDRATVAQAVKKQAFSRGFRQSAKADAGLPDQVDRLLEQDALSFLSLVNKAGLAVTGTMKVDSALRGGRVVALLHAHEAAADGAAKLDRLARGVMSERGGDVTRINVFSSSQLDLAFGRTNVIHAALNAGAASAAFLVKLFRLVRYRAGVGTSAMAAIVADPEAATSEHDETDPN